MANHEAEAKSGNLAASIIGGLVVIGAGIAIQGYVDKIALGDLTINIGQSLSMAGIVILLFPVIKLFFTDPLGTAIQERNSQLEATFTDAENLRTEMQKMRSDYETKLTAAESKAREEIQSAVKEAQILRQTIMAEATERADELVKKAQAEIEGEKAKLIVELRTKVVDLSLAAAEKVIGENMDTEKNRRLVQDFINQVEVAR